MPQQGLNLPIPIPNAGTSAAPALSEFNNQLYLAWKGEGNGTGIWWSKFDGSSWAPQQRVPNVGTSAAPALADEFPRALYMAWKGEGNGTGIWWSR